MSKKTFGLIASFVIVFTGAGAIAFMVGSQNSKKPQNSFAAKEIPTITEPSSGPEVAAKKTYKDEAGFSFSYPSIFTVTDATPSNDSSYYSLVSIKLEGSDGKLHVKDTSYKSTSDWMKKDKMAPKNATLSGSTKFGSLTASIYKTKTNSYTIAIDSGVLYMLDVPIADKWDTLETSMAESLTFGNSDTNTSKSQSSGDTIYEDEEVVE